MPTREPLTAGARRIFVLAAVPVVLGLMVARWIAATERPLHWDELLFLSRVHEWSRGTLPVALQTAHVWLFAWIPHVAGDETTQALAGRVPGELALCATLTALFVLARRCSGLAGAVAAVVLFLDCPSVVRHAGSFRVDPFISPLLLSSALLLTAERWRPVLAGSLLGAGFALTVKTALFVPVLVVLCRAKRWTLPFLGAAAVSASVLLVMHRMFGVVPEGTLTQASGTVLAKGFFIHGPPDGRGAILLQSIVEWPEGWLTIIVGALLLVRSRFREMAPFWTRARLAAALLPCAYPFLYRNTFDYFVPVMLLFPMLVAGTAVELIAARARVLPIALAFLAAGRALLSGPDFDPAVLTRQRSLVQAAHWLFPSGAPYIDRAAMLGTFEKVGPFMSTWVLRRYLAEGVPFLPNARTTPQLIVLNHPALRRALYGEPLLGLLPEDETLIRERYVPLGHYFAVPGIRARLAAGADIRFHVAVTADYDVVPGSACMLADQPGPGPHLLIAGSSYRAVGIGRGGECIIRMIPPGASIEARTRDISAVLAEKFPALAAPGQLF